MWLAEEKTWRAVGKREAVGRKRGKTDERAVMTKKSGTGDMTGRKFKRSFDSSKRMAEEHVTHCIRKEGKGIKTNEAQMSQPHQKVYRSLEQAVSPRKEKVGKIGCLAKPRQGRKKRAAETNFNAQKRGLRLCSICAKADEA